MELLSHRIKLSLLDDSDLPLFIDMSMCPDMMRYVGEPCSYDEAKAAFDVKSKPWTLKNDTWLSLGITSAPTGEKLGNIGLKITHHESKIAEIGFMIKNSAQRKGFGVEAVGLLKNYAFDELNLNKLVATCSVDNTGSYTLLEKAGFVREGCLRQNTVINNTFVDDYIYGLCQTKV